MTLEELEARISKGCVIKCFSNEQKRNVLHMMRDLGYVVPDNMLEYLDMGFPYVGYNNSTGHIDGFHDRYVRKVEPYVIRADTALEAWSNGFFSLDGVAILIDW